MEEIENETKRKILLSLREENELDRKELKERTGRSKKTVHEQLKELNDLGAVLSHRVGDEPTWKYQYKLDKDKVNFSRRTDEFIPDLVSFVPSVLIPFTLYFLVKKLSFQIFLGVSMAILFPFLWKIYQIFTVEDHFIVRIEGG